MEKQSVPIAKITVAHIRAYLASELDRGIAESTVSGYQTIFNSLFGWLWREGLIRKNPCANIATIKTPTLEKLPFTNVEIELIKENCSCLRDKAIIMFLLATGCRIEEATHINRSDIDFVNKELKVYGKGKKERTVYLDDVASSVLQRYLASRTDEHPALFIGRLSDRLKPDGVRRMMKRLEGTAGVTNIHPHRFRRTLATNLANKGMSIQEIACILGHSDINTTMQYICRVSRKLRT